MRHGNVVSRSPRLTLVPRLSGGVVVMHLPSPDHAIIQAYPGASGNGKRQPDEGCLSVRGSWLSP
jgi:hypothetical protein